MTALLVDAQAGFLASDGVSVAPHAPLLLSRAAHCSGDCRPGGLPDLAQDLYLLDSAKAQNRLAQALANGGAWRLGSSDLALVAEGLPTTLELAGAGLAPEDRPDDAFDWVPHMDRIAPPAANIAPEALSLWPKDRPVAARLQIGGGRFSTARLVTVDEDVVPITFSPLHSGAAVVDYRQAMADWVVAEVPIEGCEVSFLERRFDGSATRTIRLAPEICDGNEVVEAALINLPRGAFREGAMPMPRDIRGRHFEAFFDLAAHPPGGTQRPVPVLAEAGASSTPMPRQKALVSPLLELLPFDRGALSLTLCPGVQYGGG